MLKYVWKYKKSMIFIRILISSINAAYTFIDIYFIKWIFDALETKSSINFLFFVIAAAGIIHMIINYLDSMYNNILQPKMSLAISEKINTEMIDKAQTIDLACYENSEFFDKYTRALSETDVRVNGVLDTFGQIVTSLLNISVIISLIATIDIIFIVFGILASIIVFIQAFIINKISYAENMEKTPFGRQQGYVRRVIYQTEYAKEIKLYPSLVLILKEIFKSAKTSLCETTERYGKRKIALSCTFLMLQLAFENILPWVFIAIRTFAGLITIGSAAAIFNATNQLPYALNGLFNIIPQMHQHSLYINNLQEILNYHSPIEEHNANNLFPNQFNKISFKNVSFSYFGNEINVLNNICIDIYKNQKIALVGINGSGKTTLIKLLTRLYDPTEGMILIDDYDIKQFDVHEYRKTFGLCFQDYMIYAMSIAENVLMRKVSCKEDIVKVEEVLKKVGLYDKVKSLPNYLDTMLTREFDDAGIFLSGGETQKLVLARALASDAQILVLDEPSSALDPIAEYEINKTILDATKDKTVVLISHRLSTTTDVDMIYYIENGEIIERGNHKSLMLWAGKYAEMYKTQARKYRRK